MHRILLYLMLPLMIIADKQSTLVMDLLKNYVRETRPYCGGKPVVVKIDVALRQIVDMNDQKQTLSTDVWMRYGWTDCDLAWDASKYDGILTINIPEDRIWLPDIVLYENTNQMLGGETAYYPVKINSSGYVQRHFPAQPHTTCSLNIKNFPFDIQTCNLTFGSWTYNDQRLRVERLRDDGDTAFYLANGEWDLVYYSVTTDVTKYTCCNGTFSSVAFEIKIRRKPGVYLMNLILPSVLVSAIGILAFFIPSQSGEKISISVTVLLSLAVFHLIISETLPPDSDSLPYLGYFFLINMVFVGVCCIMSVVILNIHYSELKNSTIIRILRYFQSKRRKLVFVDKTNHFDVTTDPTKNMATTDTQTDEIYIQQNENQIPKCLQKLGLAANEESLLNDLLREMANSFVEKRKAEKQRAELETAENYVNRIFIIIALTIYVVLLLTLFKLFDY